MFQSLIGWLQTHTGVILSSYLLMFQSLIGWLQTLGTLVEKNFIKKVSIPYRLATNKPDTRFWRDRADMFQSLIGWLQTILKRVIGFMVTSVSIPYRLATNNVVCRILSFLVPCFNPL